MINIQNVKCNTEVEALAQMVCMKISPILYLPSDSRITEVEELAQICAQLSVEFS